MVFPVFMYGSESWILKKAEHWGIDAFKLWCWRRLLRVPWTARRSNQSVLSEINPEYSWRVWCWSWNSRILVIWCEQLTHQKSPCSWEGPFAGREHQRMSFPGWHHQCNGHELEQTFRDSEGQRGLVCFIPYGRKESDMTGWLNKCLFNRQKLPAD